MPVAGSDAAKREAVLRQDWQDLKADLRRWTRAERISACFIVFALATLPPTLALFTQG